MASPPFRRTAPATPPPRIKSLFAALTMASVSISVRSPCWITILSASGFIARAFFPATFCREYSYTLRHFVYNRNFFAHAARHLTARGNGFLRSVRRTDQLDSLHLRRWIKKVHADAALAENDDVRKIRNGKRSSATSKNCARFSKLVENRKQFELHLQLIRNRFDDEFRLANRVFHIRGRRDQRERLDAHAGFEPIARNSFFERLPDPGLSLFERARRNIFEDRLVSAKCGSIRNPSPQRARANHGNGFHIHLLFSLRLKEQTRMVNSEGRWNQLRATSARFLRPGT